MVVDSCPAGIPLSEEDIQKDLDRRRPGQSPFQLPARKAIRSKFYPGFLKDAPPERPSHLSFVTPIKGLMTIRKYPKYTGPDMPIIPMIKSMAFVITVEADVLPAGKRQRGWQREL